MRFQLSGNGQDSSNNVVIRTVETPDGSLGSSAGPHLSDAAEQYVSFATLSVPGMTDLVLAGPDHPDVATRDSSEPYQWVPGDDYDTGAITYLYSVNDQPSGLAAWVEDFKSTYSADNTVRATLTLDDGVSGTPTTPEQLAGLVTAGEPVVSGNAVVVNPVLLSGLVTAGEPAVSGNATIAAPAAPADTAMWAWVRSLHIPWIDNLEPAQPPAAGQGIRRRYAARGERRQRRVAGAMAGDVQPGHAGGVGRGIHAAPARRRDGSGVAATAGDVAR